MSVLERPTLAAIALWGLSAAVAAAMARAEAQAPQRPAQSQAELKRLVRSDDSAARWSAARELTAAGLAPTGSRIAGLEDAGEALPEAVIKMVFFSGQNKAGRRLYAVNRCYLHPSMVKKLKKAIAALKEDGFRLMLRDCYRPLSVQRELKATSHQSLMVAATRSKHPRGAAVDVALADGEGTYLGAAPEAMPFSESQRTDADVPEPFLARRAALRGAMSAAGLRGIRSEWWHFELPGSRGRFPAHDVPVEAVGRWVGPARTRDAGATKGRKPQPLN